MRRDDPENTPGLCRDSAMNLRDEIISQLSDIGNGAVVLSYRFPRWK